MKYPKGPVAYEHHIDDTGAKHAQLGLEQDPGIAGHELSLATTAVAFLDAALKRRKAAEAWLASDALSDATGGNPTLSRK